MTPRPYEPSDYLTLAAWWTIHKWPAIPEHALPKTGFIIDGLCAGFLYTTDSSIALLEWVIGNPLCDKLKRDEALDVLIDELVRVAKERGFKSIFSSCVHPKLIERYQRHGFLITDTGVSNLILGV